MCRLIRVDTFFGNAFSPHFTAKMFFTIETQEENFTYYLYCFLFIFNPFPNDKFSTFLNLEEIADENFKFDKYGL